VREALRYELERQVSLAQAKENIIQETRLWDAEKQVTVSMRSKEEAQDYRYFTEPDLVPFMVDEHVIEEMRASLPELPEKRTNRFIKEYGLSEYDAAILTGHVDIAGYFEECASLYENRKTIANWIMGDIMAQMNLKNLGISDIGIPPKNLIELIKMIEVKTISGKMAKEVLIEMVEAKKSAKDIVNAGSLSQISDRDAIDKIIRDVLAVNEKSVNDYKNGKKNAMTFLIGQVMRRTQGKANPEVVNEILKKRLGE
jgi:aspartyl-tRNA(Asn)/glutamyl-tRNA(Gln) amidotransferase subunit B